MFICPLFRSIILHIEQRISMTAGRSAVNSQPSSRRTVQNNFGAHLAPMAAALWHAIHANNYSPFTRRRGDDWRRFVAGRDRQTDRDGLYEYRRRWRRNGPGFISLPRSHDIADAFSLVGGRCNRLYRSRCRRIACYTPVAGRSLSVVRPSVVSRQ